MDYIFLVRYKVKHLTCRLGKGSITKITGKFHNLIFFSYSTTMHEKYSHVNYFSNILNIVLNFDPW